MSKLNVEGRVAEGVDILREIEEQAKSEADPHYLVVSAICTAGTMDALLCAKLTEIHQEIVKLRMDLVKEKL